ncbi:hypothetical protein PR048_000867 [Dryococelus australis]|uniref:Uncharacterized protein n=1 Tax=Dryococelus australis TaxID=614101 RepID=A0ABQ9IFX0_9NEOP|nr:hypothetical protein PR048_000867 [Dryococelus australis]
MEQHRNVRVEETGDPRENYPTSSIVRSDFHLLVQILLYPLWVIGGAGPLRWHEDMAKHRSFRRFLQMSNCLYLLSWR